MGKAKDTASAVLDWLQDHEGCAIFVMCAAILVLVWALAVVTDVAYTLEDGRACRALCDGSGTQGYRYGGTCTCVDSGGTRWTVPTRLEKVSE